MEGTGTSHYLKVCVTIYRISSNKSRAVYLFQVHKLCVYYMYSRVQTKQGRGLFH